MEKRRLLYSGNNSWSSLLTVTVNTCKESADSTKIPILTGTDIVSSDLSNKYQMKVFPNPNTGLFTITLNMQLSDQEKVKMRIVNILGQEVFNSQYFVKDNYIKENVELDRSLPTGVYTLQVFIGNVVESTSMVLSR